MIEKNKQRSRERVLKIEAAGRREEGRGGERGRQLCASNARRSKRKISLNKEEQVWEIACRRA